MDANKSVNSNNLLRSEPKEIEIEKDVEGDAGLVTGGNNQRDNTKASHLVAPSSSSSSLDNDDHLADYPKRVECAVTGVIWNKMYPAPSDSDDIFPRDSIRFFGRAPWFNSLALTSDWFCDRYATNWFLTVGIPLRVLTTLAWRSHISCYEHDLYVDHGKMLQGQCEAFARTVIN